MWTSGDAVSFLRYIQCRRESLTEWESEALSHTFLALALTSRGMRSLFRAWKAPLYAALGRLYVEATLFRVATCQCFRFGDVSIPVSATCVGHNRCVTRWKDLEPSRLPAPPRFDAMRASRGQWAWVEEQEEI
jgi:hypothetical protein